MRFALGLLVLVLVAGVKVYGARRWLGLGSFGIQPAEIAKLATLVAISYYLFHHTLQSRRELKTVWVVVVIGAPFVLIMLEPDLGSALVLIPICFGLMFVAGVRVKHNRFQHPDEHPDIHADFHNHRHSHGDRHVHSFCYRHFEPVSDIYALFHDHEHAHAHLYGHEHEHEYRDDVVDQHPHGNQHQHLGYQHRYQHSHQYPQLDSHPDEDLHSHVYSYQHTSKHCHVDFYIYVYGYVYGVQYSQRHPDGGHGFRFPGFQCSEQCHHNRRVFGRRGTAGRVNRYQLFHSEHDGGDSDGFRHWKYSRHHEFGPAQQQRHNLDHYERFRDDSDLHLQRQRAR